jgi:hypothetical protein
MLEFWSNPAESPAHHPSRRRMFFLISVERRRTSEARWDEIISECEFLFSYTSPRHVFLYIHLKENEVKARHLGLKSYLKKHSYFPTLQEDECFYLCSSKGDVQARYNGMK